MRMKRLRVLLDCDGVLSDFLPFALQTMQELSGKLYTAEQIVDWDLFQTFDPAWKHDFFYECGRPGVATSLRVCEGALEGVARLREWADVMVVTAPMRNAPFWLAEREVWLHKHFGFTRDQIVHTEAKHICSGDVFVDDKPSNVRLWAQENPGGIGLLWDATYNRLDRGLTRALSWDDVVRVTRTLAERDDRGILCKDSRGSLGSIW